MKESSGGVETVISSTVSCGLSSMKQQVSEQKQQIIQQQQQKLQHDRENEHDHESGLLLDIMPGKSIGSFILGTPLRVVVDYLTGKCRRTVRDVELVYDENSPLSEDLIINLTSDGVLLRFDSTNQCLKVIEIYDVSRVRLRYTGKIFGSSMMAPSFVLIYRLFGPSYPGDYDEKTHTYILHYPGLSFYFPIPDKHEPWYKRMGTGLPLEFPDGTTPVTNRICVYAGKNFRAPIVPPFSKLLNFYYFEKVIVNVGRGIEFHQQRRQICFGDYCQDVISVAGAPQRIFYKGEDKMRIHAGDLGTCCADYFFNYFDLGIDILFDSIDHTVKKFVLHTNFPGHADFNRYHKCNFAILAEDGNATFENSIIRSNNGIMIKELEQEYVNGITPDSKWNSIKQLLGPPLGKPVILNRGSTANPFGATFFFGYPHIIFEVMQNGHIASLTLFASSVSAENTK